ncbi:globin domain-containing protein [Nigerium massiliense]|uniref:globin domain-containing protein n=1 Tax=Nigerium massiliense TaxID=1522317 RepID=UPI00058D788B|nr:globin domain-containing protein [Nigerium massiliense]
MLSEKSRPVIEATAPVIAERIPHITPLFYRRMFTARPDLLDGMFSRSNQKSGEQPRALAGSIVNFAVHLLNHPDSYPDAVLSRIANKHAALGLQEDEYPTVYEHLFAAIADDLGDAATPEVVEAWTEVYWLMAHALIRMEKGLYASQANDKMFAPWTVVDRQETGHDVVVFTFEPADDTPVTQALPGQYVSIQTVVSDGIKQPRQFTLLPAQTSQRRFAVKLDPKGEVTPLLHASLKVGDVVELSNPYGDLILRDVDNPLVTMSAGIGVTPMLALLDALKEKNPQREVLVVHADHSPDAWPLADEMKADVDALPNATLKTFFEEPGTGDFDGFLDVTKLDIPEDANVVLCGPLPFLQHTREQLLAANVPAERIFYEIFGPDVWQVQGAVG